jgi:D-arginine dehydrogenase
MIRKADIVVIGAGIAGASLAAELAPHASIILLEAEERPGYHSTGRSAAFWSESYGGPMVQPLTTASGPFLRDPPEGFGDEPFLSPRGALHIADAEGVPILAEMEREFEGTGLAFERLGRDALASLIPGLKEGWNSGLYEPSCADIDVAALHGAYLKVGRRLGVELVTNARVARIDRGSEGLLLETPAGNFQAGIVVNAAGAWADEVAAMAQVAPLGIQPCRRTIAQLRVDPPASGKLPLILDASERFYFKPEAGGRIWLTPYDETPCEASDCAADEYDIAVAIDRLQRVVDWQVERVEHSWAGLRSFAPDRLPVYGYAPGRDDYFWFAGQGGFGIQTSPAAAKLAAALLLKRPPDPMVAGIDPGPYRPGRFTN